MRKFALPIVCFAGAAVLLFILYVTYKNNPPSPEEITTSHAESIFYAYDGNHSAMANDGVYEEYKRYNVSKDQESYWLFDIQNQQYEALLSATEPVDMKIAYCKLLLTVRRTEDVEMLSKLVEFIPTSSLFNKLPDSSKIYVYEALKDAILKFDETDDVALEAIAVRAYLSVLADDTEDESIKTFAESYEKELQGVRPKE